MSRKLAGRIWAAGRAWLLRGARGIGLVTLVTLAAFGAAPPPAQAAAGSWATYLFDAGRSGFNGAEAIITQTSAPHLRLHWQFHEGSHIFTQPVVANSLIYWGSFDGYEHATQLSGAEAWRTVIGKTTSPCHGNTTGVTSTATVAAIGGTSALFVGGGNAQFYALNATTGGVLWHTALGSSPSHFIWSSPAVYNGSVYIGLASLDDCPLVPGQLIQLSAATGAIQHTFTVVPTGCIGGGVWGSPTIDQAAGTVYFPTGNPGTCSTAEPLTEAVVEVRAADLGFVSAWQVPQKPGDLDFGSAPTLFTATIAGVSRSLVGIVNKNGTYYALDRADLHAGPVWRAKVAAGGGSPAIGSIAPSAWDGTSLYAAGGSTTINGAACAGSLRALDPATGAFRWQVCLTSGPVLGAVTAVPGLAVVGAGRDIVVVGTTGANAGKVLFTHTESTSGSSFTGPASIANGVLYQGNKDGNLDAIGT